MFGAGGGTSSYREVEETDLVILWGSNARETHPIFFHHLLRGVRRGARLYAVDPRRTSSAAWADTWLGIDVGSDIALANAIGREIIAAGLENRAFVERATSGFDAYRAKVESYTLAYAERETGVPAERIRELAHAYATAPRAMICWTLGDHRAPQRRRQRPRPDLARAPHRPRRALRQRPQPAARPEQRPGRRRHGRAPRPPPGLPARGAGRAADAVRRGVGRDGAAEAREAPLGHVRRDGARGADRALRDRREPGPVRGGPGEGDPAPVRPRPPRRPGHLPDPDGPARGRGPAGGRRVGRDRRHRDELGAARAARPQGPGAARPGARRPGHHLRAGTPPRRRVGRAVRRGGLGRAAPALPRSMPG